MKRIGSREARLVRQVLRTEFRSTRYVGMLPRAERAFSDLTKSQHAIGCVNGTATLHVALEALGVGHGDEVIVPSLTMSATCFAVIHANATPIFADVDSVTWQIDPNSVMKLISSRTKAIITVALYGGSPDYDALLKVAGKIPLIEDNAEAIGTTYRKQPIGGFGAFASYSFQSSKHLSAGEGGMLTTNDSELATKARLIQTLGYAAVKNPETRKIPKAQIQNPAYLRHESVGWNYRMPELIAAVVLGQVSRAESLVMTRRKTAEILHSTVEKTSWLRPQGHHPESQSSFWSFGVTLEREDLSWEDFYAAFLSFGGRGIYAAWALGYQEPAFTNLSLLGREKFLTRDAKKLYSAGINPVAETLQKKILAFRTNEWSSNARRSQRKALEQTIALFDKT